jgi:integrase/recombinase XerD
MANQGKAAYIAPKQFDKLIMRVNNENRYPERDTCLLELAYRTGMRSQSLAGIKLSEVLNQNGQVVRRCVLDSSIVKGGKNYVVFLSHPKLIVAIQRYLEVRPTDTDIENLFITQRGNGFTAHGISELIADMMKRYDLKGASAHSLRRSFCSNKLNQGADLPSLKVLMNHSNVNTTILYCETDERKLEELVANGD